MEIKQAIAGITLIIIGILTPVILQDITVSIIVVPIGIYLLATKENVMN